jgi:hypothetical protein
VDKRYRYAPLRFAFGGRESNIGVVVHAPDGRYFRVLVLSHGDLVRRLHHVPQEALERLEDAVHRLEVTGRLAADQPGLLEHLAPPEGFVRLGTVHEAAARDLDWAAFQHFSDIAHPHVLGGG